MDDSTRPPQKRHRSANYTAALVAILLTGTQLSFASTNDSVSTPSPDVLISTNSSAHEISITTVKSGREGLELTARFTEGSHETVSDMAWTIRNDAGEKVFDGITPLADAILPPGDYRVTARYGATQILQGVTVHEGTKLSVSFILNAGGLRILPRVKGLGAQTMPSFSKIFALSGPLRGQLITTSHTPGEILKVSAGEYRVESRFENGNAVAVTDVKVKPGIMSAVNIDHKAGVAKLTYLGLNSQDVRWIIRDKSGASLPTLFGPEADIVLSAGHYKVEVVTAEQTLSAEMEITSGETSIINLGN